MMVGADGGVVEVGVVGSDVGTSVDGGGAVEGGLEVVCF